LTTPVAFHLQHAMNYSMPIWRYMAKEFAEFVIEASAARPESIAPNLLPVISLCRKVVARPAVFDDVRPSLTARVWGRLLASARPLPLFGRLAGRDRGQDANRHRLSKACVAAISASSVIMNGASQHG